MRYLIMATFNNEIGKPLETSLPIEDKGDTYRHI